MSGLRMYNSENNKCFHAFRLTVCANESEYWLSIFLQSQLWRALFTVMNPTHLLYRLMLSFIL